MSQTNYLTMDKYNVLKTSELKSTGFSDSTIDTIHHIVDSINKADNCISNISNSSNEKESKEILNYEGYTGTKTRHFYNNICSKLIDARYLEIGTWNGSSSISAVYKNNIYALFIDNWSQFNGTPDIFKKAITEFGKTSECYLLEADCWKINLSEIGKFNIYLYDGAHTELDHFKALEYYLPNLDDEFIFMVDDWNWPEVRDGTMRAIRECNLTMKFRHEIFVSSDDLKGMPNHNGKKTWWNGIGIFLLSKN